jgi:hypothetical protein
MREAPIREAQPTTVVRWASCYLAEATISVVAAWEGYMR